MSAVRIIQENNITPRIAECASPLFPLTLLRLFFSSNDFGTCLPVFFRLDFVFKLPRRTRCAFRCLQDSSSGWFDCIDFSLLMLAEYRVHCASAGAFHSHVEL